MSPFLARIQARSESRKASAVASCTRFCAPFGAVTLSIQPKELLSALSKLHSAIGIPTGSLQFDSESSDLIECSIRNHSLKGHSVLASIADTLSPTLVKAGWWGVEVSAVPGSSTSATIRMIRNPPSE